MSAISDKPTIDPLLLHFLTKFRKLSPDATPLKINPKVSAVYLCNQYCISNSAVYLESDKEIALLGPRVSSLEDSEIVSAVSSLVAAAEVALKAPKITICGTEKKPALLVGLNSVSIHATAEARIKNLTIYLSEKAVFDIDCAGFSAFQNVKVVRVTLEDKKVSFRTQAHWETHADLVSFFKG